MQAPSFGPLCPPDFSTKLSMSINAALFMVCRIAHERAYALQIYILLLTNNSMLVYCLVMQITQMTRTYEIRTRTATVATFTAANKAEAREIIASRKILPSCESWLARLANDYDGAEDGNLWYYPAVDFDATKSGLNSERNDG